MRERTLEGVGEESRETPWDLADALADLAEAGEEAREDGFPVPDQELLDRSEKLLRKLYAVWPHRFEVYPNPDGEIAIDARNDRGWAVLILCEPAGEVLCLEHVNGEQRSHRHPSVDNLPDESLTKALSSLEHAPG